MNLLLDSQALLWWREGNRRLGPRARAAIETNARTVRVSVATAWELAIKSRGGRLKIREPLHRWLPSAIETSGFELLMVTLEHALAVADLADHHDDPFDRMLIAQAQIDDLTLVTSDSAFEDYDVKLLDARS